MPTHTTQTHTRVMVVLIGTRRCRRRRRRRNTLHIVHIMHDADRRQWRHIRPVTA